MLSLAVSASPFDLAFGLPLHPLAVHLPVVLLPLGAIGVVLALLVPRWRASLGWAMVAVLGVAAVSALVAKLSGEALEMDAPRTDKDPLPGARGRPWNYVGRFPGARSPTQMDRSMWWF